MSPEEGQASKERAEDEREPGRPKPEDQRSRPIPEGRSESLTGGGGLVREADSDDRHS